jgi:uncharacterized repeat protein (TIGR02543 family)
MLRAFQKLIVPGVLAVWVSVLGSAYAQQQGGGPPVQPPGQARIAEILADRSVDWKNPAARQRAVERIREIEVANKERARVKAEAEGIPMRRVYPDGRVQEIVGLDENGEFLIYSTRNSNAAISSAANLVYPVPYNLDGTGLRVGVWDEGAVRHTHQEFGGRAVQRDSATTFSSHHTHVAGTVGAAGIVASAKGMAPNVSIDSYDWTNDDSEMTGAGATAAGQTTRIYISNHSYGFARGWNGNVWNGTGTNQNAYAVQFGQYTSKASSWDSIAYNAPYYLIFHSAGNDNSENPANGASVTIGGVSGITYDRTIHPPGDGLYRNTTTLPANGYENIGDQANSKNIMVVGAANDAVTSGLRDPSKSTLTAFSSRGPTDDGRIKPDIVANGASLYSSEVGGDTAYGNKSGTSMSGPSAAGSAALLVQLYSDLFDGGAMRASTLKGLILHTATDIGNPGPDYHYGWGLIDTKTAADVIIDQHADPTSPRMFEDVLDTSVPSRTYTFSWDGVSPLRATLCWTDPAGAATSTHDLRTPRLVNDLDLKIIAPNGTEYLPWVMPFVGTWTVASMSAHATTGTNSTDNVEQVLIQNPAQQGTWQIVITHKGTLTNNQQIYSLLLSGFDASPLSMAVSRGTSDIAVGGVDGVSGLSAGAGNPITYTISNVGGGVLELTTPVTVGSTNNCAVTVSTQPTSTVAGGGSTSLVLTVTPAAEGSWSFGVSIANNDAEKNPYHWTVTGITSGGGTNETTLTAVADTYINEASATQNYGSETVFSIWNRTSNRRNGLLRFDLSSIPVGATITSATLDFISNNGQSGTVEIYEATNSWTEGGATWNNSSSLVGSTSYGSATAPGTAGSAVPSISLNASGIAKIQSWVDAPSGNHGFGLKTSNANPNQNIDLRSREHATEADRPRLTVTYDSGGGGAEAPLMAVTRDSVYLASGGTDSVSGTESTLGKQLTYAIANLGTANLTLTTPITISGQSNCSVTVNTQPGSSVSPSGSTNLVLTVTPSAVGAWSATVSIANNTDGSPYTWTISGTALGRYSVTYHANNADSGSAPVDANSPYLEGATVTVLGNTGNLVRAGFVFGGWNTQANGGGTTYAPGATFAMPADNITLYAKWNSAPVVNAGPNQTVYLTGGEWTPLLLSPGLWLDASDTTTITLNGSTVSAWADKSGFNRHATAAGTAQPTATTNGLNGKRVLTFDGSTDVLNVDLDFLAGVHHSAFIVTKPVQFSNIYGAANGSAGSNSLHVGFSSATNYRMNFWGNDYTPLLTTNFVAGSANVMNYVWTAGTGKQILANGKSEGTNTSAGNIGPMSGGGRIGRTTAHGFFGGDIAEIVILTGVLNQEERQAMEGYLAHKWGLTGHLATNHPYKTEQPSGTTATATLAGSATDPDGDPLTTLWTRESGPSTFVTFADVSVTNTTVTFLNEGLYTLRLTANDGFQQAYDEVEVTVGPPVVSYTVSYHANEATGGAVPVDENSPYVADSEVTVLGPASLVRTGYTFAGWNTQAAGNGTAYAVGAKFNISANTALYAQWTANTYTVTFNANGGSSPDPATKPVVYGSPYGPLAATSLTGYSLDGWFTAASGGMQITTETTVTNTADHMLYAQWTLIPVSVITDKSTVNVAEGSTETFQAKLSHQPASTINVTVARMSGDTDITVQSGSALTFTTGNWETWQMVTLAAAVDADTENGQATITLTPDDVNYLSAEVTAIEIDKDTTLTVTNDGSGTTDPAGEVIVEKGVATPILAHVPVSHNFVNWTITSGSATFGDANAPSTTVTITAPATIRANFAIKTYTLTYSAGVGGTIDGASPQVVNHGSNGTQVTAVPDNGYSFVKWSDNVMTAARTDTGVTANITVEAEFSANTYTVTFDANGGDAPSQSSKEVTYNAAYGALATTQRTGYTLVGWFTDPDYGHGVTSETIVSVAGNHVLYARWTPNTYLVTFDKQEGSGGSDSVEVTFDEPMPAATAPTRSGFSFGGYYTAADGGGTQYYTATMTSARNWDLLENVALYALWFAGADGTWIQTTAGPFDWGAATNWSGNTIATGADRTAYFTPNITAAQVVNLDADRTIGNITFTDSTSSSHNLTISGTNRLTLSRTSGLPVIDVTQSGRTLTISGEIAGNNGLQKVGPGNLTLSGTNTFTGGLTYGGGGTLTTSTNVNLGAVGSGVVFSGTNTWYMGAIATIYNRNVTYGADSYITHTSGNSSKTISGVVGGSGTAFYNHTTSFIWNNPSNTFTGNIIAQTGNNQLGYGFEVASLPDAAGVGSVTLGTSGGGGSFRWTGTGGDKTFAHRQFILGGTTQAGLIQNFSSDGSRLIINRDLGISGVGNKLLNLAGTSTGTNNFAGNIADGPGSVISLAKSQTGSWALSGTNTYSGTTTMNAGSGTLIFQGRDAFSTNSPRITLTQNSSSTSALRLLFDGSGTINLPTELTINHQNAVLGITVFVGNNSVANGGNGAGAGADATIAFGKLTFTNLNNSQGLVGIAGVNGANGYRLQLNNVDLPAFSFTSLATWTARLTASTAPITLAGTIQQVAGTTGFATQPVLSFAGDMTGNFVTGSIRDAVDYPDNTSTRALNITKLNSGTWTFSGTNSYSGTTTVSAGKLFIDGDSSAATNDISVAASATLGGGGSVGGNVTVANNGRLEFNISTAPGSHDSLDLATGKTLTFSGASVLTITTTGGGAVGAYTLVTGGNNIAGVAPATVNLPVGWEGSVSIDGNSLILNVTVVSSVSVPDVVGFTQAAAESSITGAGLAVGTVSYENHASVPAGNVISQSPIGGTMVAGGSPVNLVVSLGPVTYSVTYNGNDNTGGNVPVDAASPYAAGSTVTVLDNTNGLVKTGHAFANWNTEADGNGTTYAPDATFTINANTTLYAQWTPDNYTVSYNANEADSGLAPDDQIKTYGVDLTLAFNTNGLAKTGHMFNGWNTQADGNGTSYAEGATYTGNAALVLYAKWTINQYTVAFQTDGTLGASLTGNTNQVVNHGANGTAVTANVPSGYQFVNWTVTDVPYSIEATVTPSNVIENMALVANFVANDALVITAASAEKVYDGTGLTTNGYSITSGNLAEGHALVSVTVTGSQTLAGASPNVPSDAEIRDGSNNDVTHLYNLTYINGALTVTQRPLTITAASDAKVYDGTALTTNGYSVTSGSPAAGDTLDSVTVTGSQTDVGSSDNVPSAASITNGSAEVVTASYAITYANGTLSVTPKNASTLTISDVGPFPYDGAAKTPEPVVNDGAVVLVKATDYTLSYAANTNAGTATVTVTGIGNYAGTQDKQFAISPAALTVTPDGGQFKVYGASDPTLGYGHTGAVGGQTPAFSGALARAPGETVGTYTITAGTLTLADNTPFLAANYTLSITAGVNFTIVKATPTVTEWPTASPIVLGQALSASTLSNGTASVAGTFAFTTPDTEPEEGGTYAASVIFTPTETASYTTVSGSVTVWVEAGVWLPFAEDFEGLTLGNLNGQSNWLASGAVVQTNLVYEGLQAAEIAGDGYVIREFADAQTNVWTDFRVQPAFLDGEPGNLDADSTSVIFFNTNGHPVVYDGLTPVVVSNVTVTTGEWVRVTVNSDYAAKTWALYINGALQKPDLDFYDATATHYTEFSVKGAGAATVPLDAIQIDLTSPFAGLPLLTVISAHGLPSPAVGTWSYALDSEINAYMPDGIITNGLIRYVCTGWTGLGSALTSGADTNFTFTITEDTTITWQWQTNYWVTLEVATE